MKFLLYRHIQMLVWAVFCLCNSSNLYAQSTPVVQFSVDKTVSCFTNNNFKFTNHSVGNNLTYNWDFKDGTFSTDVNPIKSFSAPGFYSVTLVATQNNINYYFTKQIVVAPEPVLSSIDIQKTFLGKSYTYISNSTIQSGSMSYFWSFGDSINSSLINPTHSYKDTGFLNVSLTVTSDYGCIAQKSKLVNITYNDSATLLPTFSINRVNQCIENNSFQFNYSNDTSNITNVDWDFGDNTLQSSLNASKKFNQIGSYIIKLSIVKDGLTYTNEKIVTITKSNAAFGSAAQADDCTVSFFANGENVSNITNYNWNFGDGCTSSQPINNHTFYPGVHQISLVVTDANGCVDSVSKSLTTTALPSNSFTSKFIINDSFQCLNNNAFNFINQSQNNCNISYLWNFGDGTSSTNYNATKSYTDTGTYKVCLTVFSGSYQQRFEKYVTITNTKVWLGVADNNWNNPLNWKCGMPNGSDNIKLSANTPFSPNISNANIEVNNIEIDKNVIGNFENCVIKVNGNITGQGLFNATSSSVVFTGNDNQFINCKMNVGELIVNNNHTLTLSTTNNDSVNVFSLLKLQNGSINTNNLLVLKSTTTQTARIDKINSGNNIGQLTGEVTIERYFQNKRAWRFYNIPFASNGNRYKYSVNNTIQKFTNISGPTGNGFDYLSTYYSLSSWSDIGNKWNSITNVFTNYTVDTCSNFANIPYFIFVRGNKNVAEVGSSDVTFSFSGKLQTGTQTKSFCNRKKGDFLFVGNPYASPVDLATVQNNSKGLSGNFYVWDPTLNSNGAYVTISNKGNGVWVTTPLAAQKDRYMQSCQAMLFQLSDTAGYVKFTEDAKTNITYVNVDGISSGNMDKLTLNLYKYNSDGTKTLVDGAITLFNKNYLKSVDDNDSKKIINPQENLGFVTDNEILSIEARPFVENDDSLHIHLSGLVDSANYAIEMVTEYSDTSVQQIVLIDSALKCSKEAVLNNVTWYYFSHQNSVSTSSQRRFSIVVRNTKSINGKVQNFEVRKQNDNAFISWQTQAERGMKKYEIQHSNDSLHFITISTLQPQNNNLTNDYSYTYLTNQQFGKHYFRIKSVDENDSVQLSSIKFIELEPVIVVNKKLIVYPNPTSGSFKIHLYTDNEKWVILNITEPVTGRVISTKSCYIAKGENTIQFEFSKENNISAGMYVLQIIDETTKQTSNIFYTKP